MAGPVFYREMTTAPRRPRFYAFRAIYASAVLVLMSTAWSVLTGTQIIRNVGDMARFGLILFNILAPLQIFVVVFLAALSGASAVAQEKDRQTLVLLLMTRMTNGELVVGKLLASLINVLVMVLAALPLFVLVILFGGVSFEQVARVFAVTLTAALAAGSLGVLMGFWREKTYQTLALTTLLLVFWLGVWQVVGSGVFGESWFSFDAGTLATVFSPLAAIQAAARPIAPIDAAVGIFGTGVNLHIWVMLLCSTALCGIAIARVRIWNPSRQLRATPADHEAASIRGVQQRLAAVPATAARRAAAAEAARAGHVDATLRVGKSGSNSRHVWDNPVLWRELCTWAYGRKIIIIRVAYVLMVALAAAGLHAAITASQTQTLSSGSTVVPEAAKWLAPLYLVSLVLINALAVTAVTTERDGKSLDLLLATDLSPKEFVFGKLGGVVSVAGLMILLPLLLTSYVWTRGGITTENVLYVKLGLLTMDFFVAMLGIHCGMRYANSRTAIGVSLGSVFFLFLGVIACMLMMISFNSSFQIQLLPFLAFIGGGGVGMLVALGAGNPSKAMVVAAILVPFATFYSITSFLLQKPLAAFLVAVFSYGFATAAMLIPALFEFDFAMGRTSGPDE